MRITQWLSISPDKIEIKREMFPNYRLKIPDLYNIPIGNVKNLVPRFFDIEKNDSLWKLASLLVNRIRTKNNASCIRIQSIGMVKTICWIQYIKRNRSWNKWWQLWKSIVRINEEFWLGKTMENLRNKIDVL